MNQIGKIVVIIVILIALLLGGTWIYQNYLSPEADEPISLNTDPAEQNNLPAIVSAEGKVIPLRETELSYTQAGRIKEILVTAGMNVRQGAPLMILESQALEAAIAQAQAGLEAAQAGLQATKTNLEQVQAVTQREESTSLFARWTDRQPGELELPAWYFDEAQEIASAQAEVEVARSILEEKQEELQQVLAEVGSSIFIEEEANLAEAQVAFLVAKDLVEKARSSPDAELRDEAQSVYDIAKSKLESAQKSYDKALDSEEAQEVLQKRARLSVALGRYELAVGSLNSLLIGDRSLEIRVAEDAVRQAETAVNEAQAGLDAAQVAQDNATLLAPFDGWIVEILVEQGETVTPGRLVIRFADISVWQVETIDISESDIVYLEVGQPAVVRLDAFPGQEFSGMVREIDLFGEESRGTMVYRVNFDFDPQDAPVRWGMTAFVEIPVP